MDDKTYEKMLNQVRRGYKLLFHREPTIELAEYPISDPHYLVRCFRVDDTYEVYNGAKDVQKMDGSTNQPIEVWNIDTLTHHPGFFNPYDGGTPPETNYKEEVEVSTRPVSDLLHLMAKHEVEAVLLTLTEEELEEGCEE